MQVTAPDPTLLDEIILQVQQLGARVVEPKDVRTTPVTQAGVLPPDFYATTNLPTRVRINGTWVEVANIEMDVAIVVDYERGAAFTRPMHEVQPGDHVVVGHDGIAVTPLERARERETFAFMQSDVSSEHTKLRAIREIAAQMRAMRTAGQKILFVLGPAVVHTGAGRYIADLIHTGYIQVIFGGNAIVTHDVETALFGTSLGISVTTGEPVEGGHRNHLRAINTVRAIGDLRRAIEQGIITHGITYEALRHDVEMVLAGSIRDDGPMPGVITDMVEAQARMRQAIRGVGMAVMISSMLHAIATGNLLPATVKTVVVDINPAVVTKLADRGTTQAVGLVTDAELFLRELARELVDRPSPCR
jgi:lysine-ketoglutarate reductase/saccharopine dehydrogenase-like protein (TIGR00300 family)